MLRPQQEKPPQRETRAPRGRGAPAHHDWRKPMQSNKDPEQQQQQQQQKPK